MAALLKRAFIFIALMLTTATGAMAGDVPQEAGHEYVDLGLSVRWATCNVGATSPEQYGDYFAWGETATKSDYTGNTYTYTADGGNTMSKYNDSDNKKVLDAADDAAAVKWGGNWRMPTLAEIQELLNADNCTWEWQAAGNTTFGGVAGYKVTSKKEGYTDKYIFLPAAGFYSGTACNQSGAMGIYWSATREANATKRGCYIDFSSEGNSWQLVDRYFGFSVRPVCTPTTYSVTLAEGTEDADQWQAKVGTNGEFKVLPVTGLEGGETVTIQYNGTRRIKRVTAVQTAAAEEQQEQAVTAATPLTMECLSDGTIKVDMNDGEGTLSSGMQYAVNGGAKTTITETTTIDGLKAGDKVQFYGVGTSTQVYGGDTQVKIAGGTATVKVYGNIMSLVDETGFATKTDLPSSDNVFFDLFYGNANLTDASGLLLPATTLAEFCYSYMFYQCTALTAAPALPATMLASSCYRNMFHGCTALTAAPELPATTLAKGCYFQMFRGCSKLASVTCKATDISATNCLFNWLYDAGTDATSPTLYVDPSMKENTGWNNGVFTVTAVQGAAAEEQQEEAVTTATPLTMECLSDGTIKVNMSGTLSTGMQYAVNGGDKTEITTTTTIEGLTTGDKVQFYGVGTETQVYGGDVEVSISGGTATVKVYGNIMSLLDETGFATKTALPSSSYVFYGLFYGNANLTDASGLLLPATTLATSCYRNMFAYCTALTAAPALPATTLADYCYMSMFEGCTALTAAPELPATTLVSCCYFQMFNGCSKLASVTCKATDITADNCLFNWLEDAGTDESVTSPKLYVDPSMLDEEWNNAGFTVKAITAGGSEPVAATYTMAADAAAGDVGKVVCAAGHLHDAKTAVPSGCTAVGILGKVTETGHGLILALEDATSQNWNTINDWTSVTSYAGTTLKVLPDDAARGSNLTSYTKLGTIDVSNWAVAQKSDYEAIFVNLGSKVADNDGTTYDANVNAYITTGVGGTAISGDYWSATVYGSGNQAWDFRSNYWANYTKSYSRSVRPVLAF